MSTSDYSIVTKTFMQIAKKTRWLKDTVPASCSGGHEIESGLGKETYMSGQFLVQYKVQQRLECYMFNIYNYTLVKKTLVLYSSGKSRRISQKHSIFLNTITSTIIFPTNFSGLLARQIFSACSLSS